MNPLFCERCGAVTGFSTGAGLFRTGKHAEWHEEQDAVVTDLQARLAELAAKPRPRRKAD